MFRDNVFLTEQRQTQQRCKPVPAPKASIPAGQAARSTNNRVMVIIPQNSKQVQRGLLLDDPPPALLHPQGTE